MELITGLVAGGTAVLGIATILLMARLDLPTATFIVLHSQPVNIAFASLTAMLPVGLYIALVRSPRLLVPDDDHLAPGSDEELRVRDLRRALDIVGIMLAWAGLVLIAFVYLSEDRDSTDDDFLLSSSFVWAVAFMTAVGASLALVYMRLATVTRRGTAGPFTRRVFGCSTAGIRGLAVLTLVVPLGIAGASAYEEYVIEPPVRVLYFEDEYRAALEAHAEDPSAAPPAGWTVRWLAPGDGGYYFLPEDVVYLDQEDPRAAVAVKDDFLGASKILWRAGEPLLVVNCDFELQTCEWRPPVLEDADGDAEPVPAP